MAQLLASLIFVLSLGPVLAIFSAIFTPASVLRHKQQLYTAQQLNAAGSGSGGGRTKYFRANYVFGELSVCMYKYMMV